MMSAQRWDGEDDNYPFSHWFSSGLFGIVPTLSSALHGIRWQGALPRVGIFGPSGAGKSSLCNALAGTMVAKVSHVEAGTRVTKPISVASSLVLVDVPGVAESPEYHARYKRLYARLMPTLDLVLWVTRADERPRAIAQEMFEDVLRPSVERVPMLAVLSQADKMDPVREARKLPWGRLGEAQRKNLRRRCDEFSSSVGMPVGDVIPVSTTGFNLRLLNRTVISKLDEVRLRVAPMHGLTAVSSPAP